MAAVPVEPEQAGPPTGLLAAVRAETRLAMRAEVRRLQLVVEWCAAHEVDPEDSATVVEFGRDTGLALAGAGAPGVSEFAVVELAAALGMTSDAGRRYVGRVLEVRYRLPGLWDEVVAGRLPWWRAARVAEHTMSLPEAGAGFVDARLARFAAKVTFGQVERLVQEALIRFDPQAAEERRRAAADGRHFDVHLEAAGHAGTVEVAGTLDLADAVDLETAIRQGAADQQALGSKESLGVRRSKAAGILARRQTTLNLNPRTGGDAGGPEAEKAGSGGGLVRPRQAVLHVHLADAALGRCATTRSPISVDQAKGWCADPDTQVVIKPVLDLNDHIHVDAYEVPGRLADQTAERDGACVFPWCTRPAPGCDKDHTVPYDQGGPTCSCNIAPLCRGHHRAKTHDRWRYRFIRPGTYLWASPHGYWYYRDGLGTTDLGHQGLPGDGFGDPPHP